MKNVLMAGLGVLLFFACGEKESTTSEAALESVDWLVGTWQVAGDSIYEEWRKVGPKEFQGRGFRVTATGDTVLHEYLQLVQWEGELVYLATVTDQNDGRPVAFPLRERSNARWVFENRQHDFPQRIVYTCTDSKDSCTAIISGFKEGEERKFSINLLRYE